MLLCDIRCLGYVGYEVEVLGGPFTCVYILGGCGGASRMSSSPKGWGHSCVKGECESISM